MRTSEIAEAYARALFDLASLSDSVDEVDAGLATLVGAVRGHAGLRETLADALVPGTKKREIMRDIFAAEAAPEALAIATAMVERGHAGLLDDVERVYREIAEKERGIVVAEVTTAMAMDDTLRKTVTEKLAASLGRPVTLREQVDGSLIGGIRIKVAGRVLDGSVASQLAAMKATLSSTPQGGEV